ncbi:MAG: CoA ester lyase [Acidimicrobiia bacterium]|nr:CoA ester lyase [Acidimicrobiia bacterium]
MTARSYLFVPGNRADMLAKAGERGADAIIADLEDAVAPAERPAARQTVAAWLADSESGRFEAWVRLSSTTNDADLAVVTPETVTGLMVPKVQSADDLAVVGGYLDQIESDAGVTGGRLRLIPIVETAVAMRALDAIAQAPRVQQLMIGELDLGADIGVDPANIEAFIPLRMALVVASAAAGIEPPLGPVSPDFRDLDAFAADTLRLAGQGFGSRPAIHPAQIPVINAAFTPDPDEVERARRLVELYEAAVAAGEGAVTDEDGHMVDEAVVRVARRVLMQANHRGAGS